MKALVLTLTTLFVLGAISAAGAVDVKSLQFGNTQVVYSYEITELEVTILTLNALVSETNNSLRGLKNSDRQRLSKLGQLIYQCRLMLRDPGDGSDITDVPMLISKNYSLYSGVDASLASGERIGIRIEALRAIDDASLFSTSLGEQNAQQGLWETLREGAAIDLRQFDVNLLKESDVIESSESLDIIVRFPVFQLEKPVREWTYNFDLRDFRSAVRHIDENCSPASLTGLIDQAS